MSTPEVSTMALPSARSVALAWAAKKVAGNCAVPIPQPSSRPCASVIERGSSGRFSHPKVFAACS